MPASEQGMSLEYVKMIKHLEGCKGFKDFEPVQDAFDMAVSGLSFLEEAISGAFQPEHLDAYSRALSNLAWAKARLEGQTNVVETELKVLKAQKEMEIRTNWSQFNPPSVKLTEAGVESKVMQNNAVMTLMTKATNLQAVAGVVAEMYKQLYHQKEIFVWKSTIWGRIFKNDPI